MMIATELSAGLGAWLLTYLIHSTTFLLIALCVVRLSKRAAPAQTEGLLKLALVGGIVSASLQVGLGIAPIGGSVHLNVPATATEVVSARPEPLTLQVEERGSLHPVASVQPDRRTATLGTPVASSLKAPALPTAQPTASLGFELGHATGLLSLAGVLGLAFLAWRWKSLRTTLAGRTPLVDGPAFETLQRLRQRAGVRGHVRLSVSERISSPIAMGVVSREICLPPRALDELDAEQLEGVLAHELAHLVWSDPLWLLLQGTMRTLFFFQPLNRVASRYLHEMAELRADAWAVAHVGSPSTFASSLTTIATWVQEGENVQKGMVPASVETHSPLARRVQSLLSGKHVQPRSPSLMRSLCLSIGALALAAWLTPRITIGQAHALAMLPPAEEVQTAPAVLWVEQVQGKTKANKSKLKLKSKSKSKATVSWVSPAAAPAPGVTTWRTAPKDGSVTWTRTERSPGGSSVGSVDARPAPEASPRPSGFSVGSVAAPPAPNSQSPKSGDFSVGSVPAPPSPSAQPRPERFFDRTAPTPPTPRGLAAAPGTAPAAPDSQPPRPNGFFSAPAAPDSQAPRPSGFFSAPTAPDSQPPRPSGFFSAPAAPDSQAPRPSGFFSAPAPPEARSPRPHGLAADRGDAPSAPLARPSGVRGSASGTTTPSRYAGTTVPRASRSEARSEARTAYARAARQSRTAATPRAFTTRSVPAWPLANSSFQGSLEGTYPRTTSLAALSARTEDLGLVGKQGDDFVLLKNLDDRLRLFVRRGGDAKQKDNAPYGYVLGDDGTLVIEVLQDGKLLRLTEASGESRLFSIDGQEREASRRLKTWSEAALKAADEYVAVARQTETLRSLKQELQLAEETLARQRSDEALFPPTATQIRRLETQARLVEKELAEVLAQDRRKGHEARVRDLARKLRKEGTHLTEY